MGVKGRNLEAKNKGSEVYSQTKASVLMSNFLGTASAAGYKQVAIPMQITGVSLGVGRPLVGRTTQ